jgi:hypothetical protein
MTLCATACHGRNTEQRHNVRDSQGTSVNGTLACKRANATALTRTIEKRTSVHPQHEQQLRAQQSRHVVVAERRPRHHDVLHTQKQRPSQHMQPPGAHNDTRQLFTTHDAVPEVPE